jgi:hypothetical protein
LTLAAQDIAEPTVLDDVEQPGFFIPLVTAVVTTGNRCYRRDAVKVPRGSNRYGFSNLNLNSKNEKNQ